MKSLVAFCSVEWRGGSGHMAALSAPRHLRTTNSSQAPEWSRSFPNHVPERCCSAASALFSACSAFVADAYESVEIKGPARQPLERMGTSCCQRHYRPTTASRREGIRRK